LAAAAAVEKTKMAAPLPLDFFLFLAPLDVFRRWLDFSFSRPPENSFFRQVSL
jgi:hypothetical protein